MGANSKAALSRPSSGDRPVRVSQVSETGTSPTRTVGILGGGRIGIGPGASTDARIRAIAERQRARVSRAQLLSADVDPNAIARRLRSGRLDSEHPGVYALANTAELPLGVEAAALLACGAGALLSHHSAATLWRLRSGVARPVHVTIPYRRGCRALAGVVVHRSTTLTGADLRIHDGLSVTSPARTLLDVAVTLTDRDVERLLDEALFARRIVTLAEVCDVLARAGGHSGRARLKRAAADHSRSTKTDSPPEERLLALIRAAALPEPELQAYVLGYRLDFFWPRLRLAVELDAYGTHGSRARFESDRRRDARLLTEKRIVVLRLTKSGIEQRPFEAVAVLARAIGQREAASDTIAAFEVGGDGKPVRTRSGPATVIGDASRSEATGEGDSPGRRGR